VLRSILLLFVYISFLGLGVSAPFIATLGYVWVDTFRPQDVSYVILNQVPVAMVMGAVAVALYFVFDRRAVPKLRAITVLQLAFAAWITLTTTLALIPDVAWEKWDWAFKTVMFSAFIPLTIRSRVQIEAFLQVYMFSLAANLVPFGLKMAISGGGYGQDLSLGGGNTGLSEGSTLAAVSVMTIPIYLYLRQHAILVPKTILFRSVYFVLAGLAVLTTIGTFERTGLIGLLTLGIVALVKSRRKILTLLVGLIVSGIAAYAMTDAWTARISTIGDYAKESSALARILVWRWTLDFASSHPFGGGFGAYRLDHIELPDGAIRFGVAFHSIYFEVLGEQGWIGLFLFLSIAAASLLALQRASKQARPHAELSWCRDLVATIQVSLIVLLVCGSFIGIAFQPMIPYLFAMAVSASEYVRRAVAALPRSPDPPESKKSLLLWRNRANDIKIGPDPSHRPHGWRHPQPTSVD
jgi:putative inorganic carbon (HCO3(-)) transporter